MKRVLIVGAGVIGLFCALRLAQRGAQVMVLEGEKEDFSLYGPSASLAAAGMLAPLSEAGGPREKHRGLDKLALASFDLWRAQTPGALWADGVRFDGGVIAFRSADAAADFSARAVSLGRSAEALSGSAWRKRSGLMAVPGEALFVADEGVADPIRVLSGLAMDARRHGAQILFGHDADTFGPQHVGVYEKGVFEADVVLLAPGVWAGDAMMEFAPALRHVQPARGHMVPVRLDRMPSANVHADGCYLARRGENDVVLGATMEFGSLNRHVDPGRVAELLTAAEGLAPGEIRKREDVSPWVGVRPMTPDWAPLIGPSGGALLACGHSRNGWLLAPATAEIICAYVFGEMISDEWAAFAPARFED
ncbi:MAG: NAD(P)/FAD-dependent oxidoreductase [Hyphomonadaceae bacterium]